ncbi:hypothetical protein SAMN05421858_3012 [Haladaptatus litoreus]|uniref:Uncharacterized protein n=1 Tax=Haladaptatus litoreus TaxID=553468 RepID=A0A1N7CHS8_9EURY|nr:hypothetical protein SAMN05421858_3012 [Haladaptatus litoreus]
MKTYMAELLVPHTRLWSSFIDYVTPSLRKRPLSKQKSKSEQPVIFSNVKTVVQRSFQSQPSVQSAIITNFGITAAAKILLNPDVLA